MFCTNCGNIIEDGERFCNKCGVENRFRSITVGKDSLNDALVRGTNVEDFPYTPQKKRSSLYVVCIVIAVLVFSFGLIYYFASKSKGENNTVSEGEEKAVGEETDTKYILKPVEDFPTLDSDDSVENKDDIDVGSNNDTPISVENQETGYQAIIIDEQDVLRKDEKTELLDIMMNITKYGNAILYVAEPHKGTTEEATKNKYSVYFNIDNDNGVIYTIDYGTNELYLMHCGELGYWFEVGTAQSIIDGASEKSAISDFESAKYTFEEYFEALKSDAPKDE